MKSAALWKHLPDPNLFHERASRPLCWSIWDANSRIRLEKHVSDNTGGPEFKEACGRSRTVVFGCNVHIAAGDIVCWREHYPDSTLGPWLWKWVCTGLWGKCCIRTFAHQHDGGYHVHAHAPTCMHMHTHTHTVHSSVDHHWTRQENCGRCKTLGGNSSIHCTNQTALSTDAWPLKKK